MILNGWKEIAQHLGRGIRTIQRWEYLGLPIRRPNRRNRSAVVAISEEVDEWLRAQPTGLRPENEKGRSGPFKRRILVVDDDEGLLITTATILMADGHEVRTARDGFEALTVMGMGLPDILVSDLRMPKMSGFELMAVVRRRFPGVGVIALSSEFSPATVSRVLTDRFVSKGVHSAAELIKAVRELLSEVPLRSQPAKFEPAPAWIPRSANGYIVLTCLDCLRSFSVATKLLELDEVASETCVHCGQEVRYFIDQTLLPVAAELPALLDYARSAEAKSPAMIKPAEAPIDESMPELGDGLAPPLKKLA